MSTSAITARPLTRRWRAFGVLAVSYFMCIVDLTIVNVALPSIGTALHFGPTRLQWVVTAYAIAFGGLLLLGGRASDLLGRRRIFMLGLGAFTAASLGCALASGQVMLVAMRGAQGAGAAMLLPAGLGSVLTLFEPGPERAKALGLWGGLAAAGSSVGLISGGLIVTAVGWRCVFLVNVPIGLLALALTRSLVPEGHSTLLSRRFDLLGATTVTAALMLAVYAVSCVPTRGWTSPATGGGLAVSLALLATFLVIESKVSQPLLPPRLLRSRTVGGANAVALTATGAFYSFLFLGTLYMQDVLGYSALGTGCAWLGTSLPAFALAQVSRRLIGRFGVRPILCTGMTLIGAAAMLLAHVPVSGTYLHDLMAPMLLGGAGTAFAFIAIAIGAVSEAHPSDAGVVSGIVNTNQQLGGAIGVAVVASLAAQRTARLAMGRDVGAAELTSGFHLGWTVASAIAFVGTAVALLVLPAHRSLSESSARPTGEESAQPFESGKEGRPAGQGSAGWRGRI